MLSIHEVTSATDAKNYYAASDYYSQGQETVGKWGGKLAEQLGLSGKVTKEAFDRMVDNQHPATGASLTPRTKAQCSKSTCCSNACLACWPQNIPRGTPFAAA